MTIVLTGLPGRPIHGRPSANKPKPSGAPGRMRMRHSLMSHPSAVSTSRTRSCSPTLTPAVVTRRSAAEARARCSRRLAALSPAMPSSTGTAPVRRMFASKV
ncbi:MAG: hypothetical protein AUG10_03710 [Gemmatimonadetes bacterium 13_1_20CM_2_70_10]|nr:MAG: hypothetical protein AUG10_03710 [Gemmatimonadetes bacterium 13_1_20CM_2_70_10]